MHMYLQIYVKLEVHVDIAAELKIPHREGSHVYCKSIRVCVSPWQSEFGSV